MRRDWAARHPIVQTTGNDSRRIRHLSFEPKSAPARSDDEMAHASVDRGQSEVQTTVSVNCTLPVDQFRPYVTLTCVGGSVSVNVRRQQRCSAMQQQRGSHPLDIHEPSIGLQAHPNRIPQFFLTSI